MAGRKLLANQKLVKARTVFYLFGVSDRQAGREQIRVRGWPEQHISVPRRDVHGVRCGHSVLCLSVCLSVCTWVGRGGANKKRVKVLYRNHKKSVDNSSGIHLDIIIFKR